jgi:G:T-mismatch repair DNA endonuclease (very short patch repair protein)
MITPEKCMEGPEPWDPHDCAPWAPVPFSKTEFKIFKILDSEEDEEDEPMFERVRWATIIPDESDFEEE